MDDPGPVSGIFYFLCDTQGQDTGRIKWLSRVSFPGATIIPVTPGVARCYEHLEAINIVNEHNSLFMTGYMVCK